MMIIAVCLIISTGTGLFIWGKIGDKVVGGVQRGYTESLKINSTALDPNRPTVVYDQNDKPILTLNRYAEYYTELDEINPYIKEGFVAVEDRRFFEHHGVDTFATMRAIVSTLRGDIQGGSTITQQLARNVILEDAEINANRKLAEMVVSQEMEKQFSKNDILQAYLNKSYFGNGAYGIAAASIRYFDKPQKDLTPKEAAIIINLTNNPTLYDPFLNPDESNKKAKVTMKTMLDSGVISQEEYDKYLNKTIKLKKGELVYDEEFTDNYAISYAIQKAAEQLAILDGFEMKYWFDTEEEYNNYHAQYNSAVQSKINKITSGGYDIHTSIDLKTQSDLEDIVRGVIENEPENLEVSVSVVDTTGNVVAMVGGRGFDTYNRSYLSTRQPGSTAKPILVYGPAFEEGKLPSDSVPDTEVPGYEYITNWYGGISGKDYSIRQAFMESLNNPAMNLAVQRPAEDMLDKLISMEFEALHPRDNTHVIGLGGMTNGVSTLEMASAYATIANNGEFRSPTNLKQIVDNKSDAVIYDSSHRTYSKVYKDYASYMITDVMKSTASGPTVHAPVLADNYPKEYQGVKTGTTDENRDSYLVGINPYYGIATWVGNDDNQPLDTDQLRLIFPINKLVSEYLLKGKKPIDFEKPDSVSKSGDKFIVNYDEDEDDEDQSISYKEVEDENRRESEDWNQSRIIEEEYRIVYGLTLEEERDRELKVVDALKKLKEAEFNNSETYPSMQEGVALVQEMIVSVRNSRVKENLQNELNDIQELISARYSELVEEENKLQMETNQKRLDVAAEAENVRRQNKINDALLKLDDVKFKIESVIKSGQDATYLIQDLDQQVNELNRLGIPTGYYQILTDGVNVSFIEGIKPKLEEG